MQAAKFIDLTRTYIPIDPNSFPSSMHGTGQEDNPEDRIPVMPYEGHNFLPTAYGYKSYFGTNTEIGIDALAANVDFVFMYQNTNFENILIALTDTGIWIKRANVAGAWTNSVPIAAPVDPAVHYEWTYVVIAQILYCYRQGHSSYQKIVSDIAAGVVITNVVPNTLNMSAQMGIFRAGGRLGFWDSDDSVAWSNQDNYADFVTSVLTLAGSQKFIDVNGRIVTIRGHGPGFMIYCTKSILFVYPSTDATMQWAVNVVFSNNGIVYSRMCVADSPDTLHYATTDSGMYKIQNAKAEPIITEVTDVLAKHAGPIYLSFLEGRYLFLEILDPTFLEGMVQFSEGTAEELLYEFPGSGLTLLQAIEEETLVGTNMCSTIGAMGAGQFATKPIVGDQMPGTSFKPVWTAYLSNSGNKDVSNITWTNTPQATIDPFGVEANQCPVGNSNKTSQLSSDATNKTVVTGAAAYIDGIWTMERFVQTQEAIWKMEQDNINAWFDKIEARGKRVEKVSNTATDLTAAMVVNKGLIGTYVSKFTPGLFSMSPCEFRLTRYCIAAREVYRIKKNIINSVDKRIPGTFLGYADWYACMQPATKPAKGAITYYGTPQAAVDARAGGAPYTPIAIDPGPQYASTPASSADGKMAYVQVASFSGSGPSVFSNHAYACFEQIAGHTLYISSTFPTPGNTPGAVYQDPTAGRYETTEIMIANNATYEIPFSAAPDVAYCTISNWSYTNTGGGTTTVAAAACGASQETIPKPWDNPTLGLDGKFCSIPFEPVTIPGVPELLLGWPGESLVLPSGSFLLQDGSIAPIYPIFEGALVYDTKLKKWGKYKGLYKTLLNYQPINNSLNGVVSYSTFGILAGILAVSGKIKLFDAYPSDSYITYGKIGYYRLGMTAAEEVHIHFASSSTGYVRVDTSISGKFYDPFLAKGQSFTEASAVRLTGANPGRWHNITIGGIYDINYLEFRGFKQGNK